MVKTSKSNGIALKKSLSSLREAGVDVVFLLNESNSNAEHFSQIVESDDLFLFEGDMKQDFIKLRNERSVDRHEVAFFATRLEEVDIFDLVNFTAVSFDAPLDLKARSYYVAYGNVEESLREVTGVILRAKAS